MELLSQDILFTLSLNLSPCYLSSINKSFTNLYNEYWFKSYLEFKYPNLNLRVITTWKDLCQKSLEEGDLGDLFQLSIKDTIFNISLNLPPCYLSSVNKKFNNLYNEHWFKSYIELKYPNFKL